MPSDDQEIPPEPPEQKRGPGRPPKSNGAPVLEKRKWDNAGGEADLLWNEILMKDGEPGGLGIGPDGYNIYVVRQNPSHASLGGFNGASAAPVAGDFLTSSQSLRDYIITNFHKVSGPAKYLVRFSLRGAGGTLTQGFLHLPSQQELASMAPNPYAQPPGMMGMPPRQPWGPPPPGYWPQPQGYPPPPPAPAPVAAPAAAPAPTLGAPIPQPTPGMDPAVAALLGQMAEMQRQIAYLSGQLGERATAPAAAPTMQMSAPLGAPPPPPQAPPPTPGSVAEVVQATVASLAQLGVIKLGAGAAAPAVAAVAIPPAGAAGQQALAQLTEALGVIRMFANIGRTFKATGAEVAEAFRDEEEEPDAATLAKPPENPDDKLPWQRVTFGEGGVWALDRDTGGPSWQGLAAEFMAKPDVRDKVGEIASKAIDLGKEFLSRTRGPQPPQLGAAPQVTQQAQTPTAPTTPSGGQGQGGWGI